MQRSEKSREIVGAFKEYTDTGDNKLIEKYSLEEIKFAMLPYAAVSNAAFYKAMENRIAALEKTNTERKSRKEKWKDRFIGSIFTIILFVIIYYLGSCLRLGGIR